MREEVGLAYAAGVLGFYGISLSLGTHYGSQAINVAGIVSCIASSVEDASTTACPAAAVSGRNLGLRSLRAFLGCDLHGG